MVMATESLRSVATFGHGFCLSVESRDQDGATDRSRERERVMKFLIGVPLVGAFVYWRYGQRLVRSTRAVKPHWSKESAPWIVAAFVVLLLAGMPYALGWNADVVASTPGLPVTTNNPLWLLTFLPAVPICALLVREGQRRKSNGAARANPDPSSGQRLQGPMTTGAPVPATAVPAPTSAPGQAFCRSCGSQSVQNDPFCTDCGARQ